MHPRLNSFGLVEALGQITLGAIIGWHGNRRVIEPDAIVAAESP
jgi:hypothetical protein